jgi:caffeoyl-CoA O-methyltransferase
MSRISACITVAAVICFLCPGSFGLSYGQTLLPPGDLDAKVSRFLEDARGSWRDLNVPYEDGKILYDLVRKGKFRNVLEIGASTGHSTIWLAWAAAGNGGKVTTIEVDKERYEEALGNFKKAGLSDFIDARLADAHVLVPALEGPYDFVFCDADKEWYLQYFLDLESKISPGGCYTAHNVLTYGGAGVARFLEYVKRNRGFRTVVEPGSGEGISITCKIPG